MAREGWRTAGLTFALLALQGSLVLASRHLLPPTGGFALSASVAACLDPSAPARPELTASCVTYETLLLHAPLLLGALAAAVGFALRKRPVAWIGAGVVAFAWLPWALYHLATRGWDHLGARSAVLQLAVFYALLAGLLAVCAWGPRLRRPRASPT